VLALPARAIVRLRWLVIAAWVAIAALMAPRASHVHEGLAVRSSYQRRQSPRQPAVHGDRAPFTSIGDCLRDQHGRIRVSALLDLLTAAPPQAVRDAGGVVAAVETHSLVPTSAPFLIAALARTSNDLQDNRFPGFGTGL
jgi:hypothetical protein